MKKTITLLVMLHFVFGMFAQTDVTYKIVNPSFEKNGAEGWTCTDMVPQTNTSFTKKQGNVYMEKWVSGGNKVGSASLKQTVKNLAKGKYRLTVAAQNIQQNSSVEQTGVTISAKTTIKTTVTVPADYSVEFDISTTSVAIAFTANNATGNYICCDNFRLTFLSTTPEIVAELIETAKGQFEKKLNDANIKALTEAIENAQKAIDDKAEDLTAVANALEDAYVEAQANTKAYTSLKSIISKAKLIVDDKMNVNYLEELNTALAEAEKALDTTDNDPVALTDALQSAYDKAKASIAAYTKLLAEIDKTKPYYDSTKNEVEAFDSAIKHAEEMYATATATDEEITEEINTLKDALLLFRLANSTPGTGKPIEVKNTNKYVPTGANEALMRADFTGDNILEKGVCWSTKRNPTVVENRTTKSFSLNGTIIHVKNLEPGTVYYLRPYIISKTYEVAYGDEVKIVTHAKGTCRGTWDEGAPTEEANTRCRNAINETIEYFNQWTGIKGFTLSGHYGAQTPTADCSYGGWMRIGPNAGNQAIGTVIHETGHGVGVGTSNRYKDTNLHNWKWYGREANDIYSFLENKEANPYTSDFCMVGDGTHAWGSSATYDWFVNGADKDKHTEIQYIGGCCLLYGFFIDGLNPTSAYTNGIAGYTFNFDDSKRYYIMNKDTNRGLGDGILYNTGSNLYWGPRLGTSEEVADDAAWILEYDPATSLYSFKNVATGKYLNHADTSVGVKTVSKATSAEKFQLMPDRTDVTINTGESSVTTHGYWFTWGNGTQANRSMMASSYSTTLGYGKVTASAFDFSDNATMQQWIIISEDELPLYNSKAVASSISLNEVTESVSNKTVTGIYNIGGAKINNVQKGINIIRYNDGTSKKIILK